jgi:hypothetical protein
MRNTIIWIYNRELLHLCVWILIGVIGSDQQFNNPQYLMEQGREPKVFDAPQFVFFFELIFALFYVSFFSMIYWLLRKKLPSTLKWFVLVCSTSFVGFTVYVAIKNLAENIHWGFYILLAQDIIWIVYAISIIQSLWKYSGIKR